MGEESGKDRMERKYGAPGSGKDVLRIGAKEFRLREILSRWMLDVEGIISVDAGQTGDGRFWIRFLDSDDLCFVVFEFDETFSILEEARADSLGWEGDDFFYSRIWAG